MSTKISRQGATPQRSRLSVPSNAWSLSRWLKFMPFSLWQLPCGSTTLELVTSGRSVSIGLSFPGHCSAAAAEAAKTESDRPINAAMPGIAFNKISNYSALLSPAKVQSFCVGRRIRLTARRLFLEKSDHVGAILRIANREHHFGAGDECLRIGEPVVKRGLVPDDVRAL